MEYVTDPNVQSKFYTYRTNIEKFKNRCLPLYVHIATASGH